MNNCDCVILQVDNQSTIALAYKNPIVHQKENIADIFTKSVIKSKMNKFINLK